MVCYVQVNLQSDITTNIPRSQKLGWLPVHQYDANVKTVYTARSQHCEHCNFNMTSASPRPFCPPARHDVRAIADRQHHAGWAHVCVCPNSPKTKKNFFRKLHSGNFQLCSGIRLQHLRNLSIRLAS